LGARALAFGGGQCAAPREEARRIDQAGVEKFLAMLQGVEIEVDDQTMARAWGKTLGLSEAYGLSVYDAAYLELALRRGLPLATLDQPLRAACAKAGAALL
jgi:predicted nucleic acid-binding protein